MLIGLLSDSHGRAATTRRAVDLLLDRGAGLLVHLGDIGTVDVIDALAVVDRDDQPVPAHVVFGNTDWDLSALSHYAKDLGIAVDHPAGRLDLDGGRTLAFCHGHDPQPMQQAVAQGVDYLCHGHTHRTLDTRRGGTRVLNPGALFRAKQYTVALLDPAGDSVDFLQVPSADAL